VNPLTAIVFRPIDKPSASNTPRWYLLAILGLLVATSVRVMALDAQSFTFDEADRVALASLPFKDSLMATSREGLHVTPLLHLLLRLVISPLNEGWARLPFALCGVLTVALVAVIAKNWLGHEAGLIALWLMALNPFHVWFSRMATMYSLMLVGVCGSMWVFGLLLERRTTPRWIALGVFTLIGTFTHHFALTVPIIQFMYVLALFRRRHGLLVPWALTQAIALLPLAAWLFWGSQILGVYYIGPAATLPTSPIDLLRTVWNFSFGYTGEITVFSMAALSLSVGVGLLGIFAAVQRRRPKHGRLTVLWFVLPLAVIFVLSFRWPMYVDRYLSPALPAFVLLWTIGLLRLRGTTRAAVLIGLLLIGIVNVGRIHLDREFYAKEDWRGAVSHIQTYEKPGDIILNVRLEWLMPLLVYYHGDAPLRGIMTLDKAAPLVDLTSDAARVWLFWPHPQDLAHLLAKCQPFDPQVQASPDQLGWMQQHAAQLIEKTEWTCISVFLYDLHKPQIP
jgi:mannosyltransferase